MGFFKKLHRMFRGKEVNKTKIQQAKQISEMGTENEA